MSATVKCDRCSKCIARENQEICWFCGGVLCFACWDAVGHCGHAEADAANEQGRAVRQPSDV